MSSASDDSPVSGTGLGLLYRRHARWLAGQLKSAGFKGPAEDVVQEAFLRVAQYTDDVRHPRALLLKIARNLAISDIRSERSARLASAEADGVLRAGETAADQFEALVFKEIVLSLPAIYQDIFVLSRFDGMSNQQIAEARGISVKTVEWRLSRAMAMCAAKMRD